MKQNKNYFLESLNASLPIDKYIFIFDRTIIYFDF